LDYRIPITIPWSRFQFHLSFCVFFPFIHLTGLFNGPANPSLKGDSSIGQKDRIMQHVSMYGYPTPPASPSFDHQGVIQSQHFPVQQHYSPHRFVPVAPEERLGRFLTPELQLTEILGIGAYGVVYLAVNIRENRQYAVKCLSQFNADGSPLDHRQKQFQLREIRLHHLASQHPNVVSIHKIIDNQDCIYVVMEYCPEGDLFKNITECGMYVGKDELAKRVFLQILDAVEHCHNLGIFHRDLKPENILVSNRGETVKLADFGLATSNIQSEDYGCGSTFYMSPECLDHSSRRPFYYCAPNDVWGLGVILVNLTCGRNPWKQASYEDSTYRAYTRSQGFLKTILPVSDELNDILGRIFTRNPDQRITLPELRVRILACPRFTEQPAALLPSPPPSPGPTSVYVNSEEAVFDDDLDYDAPLSPASSDSMSDEGSTCSSDEGSLTSSCSSLEDLEDDDDFEDLPQAKTPPPQMNPSEPAIYEPEFYPRQDYMQPYGAVPELVHPMPVPVQQPYAPSKFHLSPYVWDMLKHAQVPPQLHHPVPFHHQVPPLVHMPACF